MWLTCWCLSFDQAKAHVQSYLRNLEENVLGREDRTELYLLFVNCFQVRLHLHSHVHRAERA